jgi:outer membrane protein, multidrug efflux system
LLRRARFAHGFLALPLLLALGGCSKDAFDATLTFAIPKRFDENKSTRPPKISRWWTRFGSAELNALMNDAYLDNLDIAAAVAQLEQADAQVKIAAAALWPQIDYSDLNERSQLSRTMTSSTPGRRVVLNSFSKILTASYILDVWGQNRDALKSAIATANATAYQVEVVRLTTRAALVNNYLIYAASRERESTAKDNLAAAERVLRVIQERRTQGTASDLDVSQQESLTEQQRAAIPPLRLAAEQARIALALLLARPVQTVHIRANSVNKLRLPTITPGMPSTLLLRRPDVRSAENLLLAGDFNVEVARKAFLPTISLTGDVGFQSAALRSLLRPESVIFDIAAGLTQPIFDGGRLSGELGLTIGQKQQLLEQYRKSILQAFTDVENALIAVRENAAQEKAQQAAVNAARRAFELSENRLTQGTIDLTTLLTVETTLFQTQDVLIQVRLARLQALASLYQALGGDWQEPVIVTSRS